MRLFSQIGCFILAITCLPLISQGQANVLEPVNNPYLKLGSTFRYAKSGDPLRDWNSNRTWKASDGRRLKAKILSVSAKGDSAQFLLPGNKNANIPLNRFSKEDQRFVREWQEVSRFFNLGYQKKTNISNTIKAQITDGAFAREGKVHETRHFRFECDVALNANTVKDFSRLFEATYLAVRALPLGLELEKPVGGKFVVRLFADVKDYYAAGGTTRASGVYLIKQRQILVPLESLGLKRVGKTFRKAKSYDPATLIHETAHAVTHQWINYMPMWVTEGLADYVAAIPYRDGTFYLNEIDHGIYRMVASNFGGDALRFRILDPEEFVCLDQNSYMARPATPEKPILLTAISPYQIKLAGAKESSQSNAPQKNKLAAKVPGSPVAAAPEKGNRRINASAIVVQRYSSSMLLIHYLLSNNQSAGFRKYLFANLNFEWDSAKYLSDYNRSMVEYDVAVKRQIAEFDVVLDNFNSQINHYNKIVRRVNRGESVSLPPLPKRPVAPKAIVVPKILASPRTADQFSRSVFRKKSVEQYLKLPAHLRL